jgi:tetratricopeptide (TPR) repeat protein
MFQSKVVSRKHCELSFSNGQWYMKDVGSSAGTFLNHIRLSQPGVVSQPHAINDGDRIQLGVTFKGGAEVYHRCVLIRVHCSVDPRDYSGQTAHDPEAAETDRDEAMDAPEGSAGRAPKYGVITEELLKREAGPDLNENAVAMFLLDRGGPNVEIREGAVAWIAERFNQEMMALLLDQGGARVPITNKVFEAAARNENGAAEMLSLLVRRHGGNIQMTDEIVMAAARNETCGVEVIQVLLNRGSGRIFVTEEVVLAAASNKATGAHMMENLLAAGGDKIRVTAEAFVHLADDDRWIMSPFLRNQLAEFVATSFTGEEQRLANFLSRVLSIYKVRNLGQKGSAEELLSAVLDIRKRTLRDRACDEVTLTVMASLASLHAQQGNLSRASYVLMQGLQESDKAFGKDHPGILSSMLNLASLYTEQGHLETAEALFRRVVDAKTNTIGPYDPERVTAMSYLALIYAEQGRWVEAHTLLLSVRIYVKSDHPEALTILANLASTYTAQGELKEAERAFKDLMSAFGGPVPPRTSQSHSLSGPGVARTWQRGLKQMWEARKLTEERELAKWFIEGCYPDQKRILGYDHPLTQATREVVKLRQVSGQEHVVDVKF